MAIFCFNEKHLSCTYDKQLQVSVPTPLWPNSYNLKQHFECEKSYKINLQKCPYQVCSLAFTVH